MKRAGSAAFDELIRTWPSAHNVSIVCGAGNNGGDGWIVAGLARDRGLCVDLVQLGAASKLTGDAALAASSSRIVAVGLNCTPPQYAEALVRAAADVTDKPVLAYPNSGERYQVEGNRWLPGDGVDDFVGAARRWHAAGARLIGGCCRTGPREIEGIASALRTSA